MATTIYREGSTDREMVKRIQKIVGATADGVWGPKTTTAVKAWQRAHMLKADGVVGPATLEEMGLTGNTAGTAAGTAAGIGAAITDGSIIKAAINTHISSWANRPLKYIAIHYTAGTTSRTGTALATRNVFLQRSASADFIVDDGSIVQINPDIRNYYCWSVGDKKNQWTGGARLNGRAVNKNTISIEICSNLKSGTSALMANHEGWYFTEQALGNARKLVRYLMREYGIQKQNVIRHYDATGKLCPGVIGWNDGPLYDTDGKILARKNNSEKWEAFVASI